MPRWFWSTAKTLVTLLLLWLLFHKVNYSTTFQHFRDITPLALIECLFLVYAALWFGTVRWQIVLRSIGKQYTTWSLFRLNLIGLFFNQALPSVIGGDGIRVWLLYRHGCSFAEAFNSVLIDRLTGFITLAGLAIYGLPVLIQRMFDIPQATTLVGLILITTALCLILFVLTRAGSRLARFRLGRFVTQTVNDMVFIAKHPMRFAAIMLLSIANQVLGIAVVWLIVRNLTSDVTLWGVMIVVPVVMILLVLPISIAGWGLREGLFVLGFGVLNVPQDVALAASIVFGLVNLVAGFIGGLFWVVEPTRLPRETPAVARQHGVAVSKQERL